MAKPDSQIITPFRWVPGQGPDLKALAHLKSNFDRPTRAMGEAWFLGPERDVYDWLLEKDLAYVSYDEIERVLTEIAGGLKNFGHADAWADWYGYLLPIWIERAFDNELEYVVEYLVTAFMAVVPDHDVSWGYRSFRSDALLTLGKAIMSPKLWPEGPDRSVNCLHLRNKLPTGYPIWGDASGDFSASMFFCLKYLPSSHVSEWTKSVFAISCPRWRAQVLVWLCGVKDLLDGKIKHPSDWPEKDRFRFSWAWSHLVGATNLAYEESTGQADREIEFLPKTNREIFNETVSKLLRERLLSEWLLSLMSYEYLFDQVTSTAVPERLRQQYRF